MSVEAAQAFIKKVSGDQELQQQLSSAQNDKSEQSLAKVVDIGSAAGFSFSGEEFRQAMTELGDEELGEAVGGIVFSGGWGMAQYQYGFEGTYSSDDEKQRDLTEKSTRE